MLHNERRETLAPRPPPLPLVPGVHALRTVAVVWIFYILILAAADYGFALSDAFTRPLPPLYYITQLLLPLSALALSVFSTASARLEHALLPAIITVMATLPLLATALTVPTSFPGPFTGTSGFVALRTLPILTVAFGLTGMSEGAAPGKGTTISPTR